MNIDKKDKGLDLGFIREIRLDDKDLNAIRIGVE